MSADMLKENENLAFLNWRRDLAQLQDSELILTPYEKNLEFWRQLWRVLERSQLLVQVIDARNPLLFRLKQISIFLIIILLSDLAFRTTIEPRYSSIHLSSSFKRSV